MSITVGLCIPKGKRSRIRLPERIEDLCAGANINIINIDMTKDLESQGPFDILLHKVLDYFKEFDTSDANQKINKLMSYAARHLEMIYR